MNHKRNMRLKRPIKLQRANNSIKNQVASDMYYNEQSKEIGLFSGQLGGVIVKDLIAKGEKALMEEKNKKDNGKKN